ncbi:hypothetical protein OVA29_04345 [Exiguobacterium sp. SL14]|nr:hypothetical protein [Exiguobacterium sp. SL14]MCY1690136.1 hypothetical protein [Exiguobacterium sp. SL14]
MHRSASTDTIRKSIFQKTSYSVRNDADEQIEKVVLGVKKAMQDEHIKNHDLVANFYKETLELACQMGSRVGMSDEFYTLVKPSLVHANDGE